MITRHAGAWVIRAPGDITDAALIAELERRGYTVRRSESIAWQNPKQLSASLGKHSNYVSALIHRLGGTVPGLTIERARGGKGRIVAVAASPEFYAFLATRPEA